MFSEYPDEGGFRGEPGVSCQGHYLVVPVGGVAKQGFEFFHTVAVDVFIEIAPGIAVDRLADQRSGDTFELFRQVLQGEVWLEVGGVGFHFCFQPGEDLFQLGADLLLFAVGGIERFAEVHEPFFRGGNEQVGVAVPQVEEDEDKQRGQDISKEHPFPEQVGKYEPSHLDDQDPGVEERDTQDDLSRPFRPHFVAGCCGISPVISDNFPGGQDVSSQHEVFVHVGEDHENIFIFHASALLVALHLSDSVVEEEFSGYQHQHRGKVPEVPALQGKRRIGERQQVEEEDGTVQQVGVADEGDKDGVLPRKSLVIEKKRDDGHHQEHDPEGEDFLGQRLVLLRQQREGEKDQQSDTCNIEVLHRAVKIARKRLICKGGQVWRGVTGDRAPDLLIPS